MVRTGKFENELRHHHAAIDIVYNIKPEDAWYKDGRAQKAAEVYFFKRAKLAAQFS